MNIRDTAVMLLFVLVGLAPANATDLDWIYNKQEMDAVSTLAAGYAGGLRCDRLIDPDVAGKYLSAAFPGRVFSATEMTKFAKIVIGIVAAQSVVLKNDPRSCAQVRAFFGPSGSTIKALVD